MATCFNILFNLNHYSSSAGEMQNATVSDISRVNEITSGQGSVCVGGEWAVWVCVDGGVEGIVGAWSGDGCNLDLDLHIAK